MKFGEMLKEARTARGVSGEELAAICNVSKSYVSNIETGKLPPPGASKVTLMCAMLGVDPKPFLEQALNQKKSARLDLKTDDDRRLVALVQLMLSDRPELVPELCELMEAKLLG